MRLLRTVLLFAATLWSVSASAQLRIVTYNTAGGPRDGLATVLHAIGDEVVNDFSTPIDVLALQEQNEDGSTTRAIVRILNDPYGERIYDYAPVIGDGTGGGIPTLIYNTRTVQLVGLPIEFGSLPDGPQARPTLRYHLRPVGYGNSADFYLYDNHYKSGSDLDDRDLRELEAIALRADLDSLGDDVHAILAGDFNIQHSDEAMYQTLLAPGAGKVIDPIGMPGRWHDDMDFRIVHTQAPSRTGIHLPNAGGMDDRFDFQLVTDELLDGIGLDLIPGSYRAFGNNGTHDLNGEITSGTGAPQPVLAALAIASDHLPVVADYRLPEIFVGDYNGDGTVGQEDLDLVLLNWGQPGIPDGWINHLPLGIIDQDVLDQVLLKWGATSGIVSATVPEPSTLTILMYVAAALAATVWPSIGEAKAAMLLGHSSESVTSRYVDPT